jgi:hypothetical protein
MGATNELDEFVLIRIMNNIEDTPTSSRSYISVRLRTYDYVSYLVAHSPYLLSCCREWVELQHMLLTAASPGGAFVPHSR